MELTDANWGTLIDVLDERIFFLSIICFLVIKNKFLALNLQGELKNSRKQVMRLIIENVLKITFWR